MEPKPVLHRIIILLAASALAVLAAFSWARLAHGLGAGAGPLAVAYVAPGGSCGGASPCYATIQEAVDASQPGGEIRVAAGTYMGVNHQGGLSQAVYLAKNLTIRGGYTTANWNTPDPQAHPTILHALVQGRVIYIAGPDISVHLEGLRLAYGNAAGLGGGTCNSQESDMGGGLYALDAQVTLAHTWVMSSTASGGGGMYLRDTAMDVSGSLIRNNSAGQGGGVCIVSSTGSFRQNQVVDNQVTHITGHGPGLLSLHSNLEITGNLIAGNQNTQAGWSGALSVNYGRSRVEDNTIRENLRTAGLAVDTGNTPTYLTVYSNTIRDNSGHGVTVSGGVHLTMTQNLVDHNGGGIGIVYSVYGAHAWIEGNLIQNNHGSGLSHCGGGLFASSGGMGMDILGNTVRNNLTGTDDFSGGDGGGVCLIGNNITLAGNWIYGNTARAYSIWGYGGGVMVRGGDPVLINNIIANNAAGKSGGGIAIRSSSPTLLHNTVASNAGIGVYVYATSGGAPAQPELYNTILTGHTTGVSVDPAALNTALLDGILWWENGANFTGTAFVLHEYSGDPYFTGPLAYDYHIGPASAALDRGVETPVSRDIDGQPRLGVPDLGVDEYWAPGVLTSLFLPYLAR